MAETRFMVRVAQGNGDWLVTVECQDGSEYAKTLAPNLDVALLMAVPYMASAAEPELFAAIGRRRESS
jgi:hypothetical protein